MTTVVGTPPGVIASGYRTAATIPVTSGLVTYWDATDASTFTYHSTNLVSQWRDKSGNNQHASQASSGLAPSHVAASINGLPAVTFSQRILTTLSPSNTKPITVLAVVRFGTTVTGRALLGAASNADATGGLGWDLSSGLLRIVHRGITAIGSSPTTVVASALHQITFTYDTGGQWAQYKDGAAFGSGTNDKTLTAGLYLSLGGLYGNTTTGVSSFGGAVGELAKYNRVLTGTERGQVESYLKTKWGTP